MGEIETISRRKEEEGENVEITLKTIGPSPPSRLITPSRIKVSSVPFQDPFNSY